MEWYELYDLAERYLELINPTSTRKIIDAGKHIGFRPGDRIIDFGCGYAEPLVLWAEHFGIGGVGIDFRPRAVERARKKISDRGFSDRIEIVEGKGAEYEFEKNSFDVAVCLGASFIWNGFRPTLKALKTAVKPGGKIMIGEPYLKSGDAPQEIMQEGTVHSEAELLEIINGEGYELSYMIRSNYDDWTRYEAGNWEGLLAWLGENPDHPERNKVLKWLHKTQDDYFRFGRKYLGWAIYILVPA